MKPQWPLLLVALVATGCATISGGTLTHEHHHQARAFSGDCLAGPPQDPVSREVAVVDAVLGGVISGTIGRIGKALRAAGEADADVVVGRYPAEFEPGAPPKCVFIAKGRWSQVASDDSYRVGDGPPVQFMNAYLVDPDFFLEIAVFSSTSGAALRLVPNYFEYRRRIDGPGRDLGSRGIALEVAVHAPGKAPTDKTAVGASLVLGTMAPGYRYNLRSGNRWAVGSSEGVGEPGYLPMEYTSAWFATFAPSVEGGTNQASRTDSQLLPRTLTITLTETRAPREFLLFLADVFDASEDELQEAAELALLESRQAEAQLAAAQASTSEHAVEPLQSVRT